MEKSCLVVWWAREAELAGEGGLWEAAARRDGTRIALIGSGDLAIGTRGARDPRSVGCNDARGTGEGARECDAEGGHDGPGPIMSAV